ncbi:hypothetical protein Bbelb_028450 [Branchiostoma belcheri]|nr:hypothetical protein Bbelb_028450 [Branchiostoma belcheri]
MFTSRGTFVRTVVRIRRHKGGDMAVGLGGQLVVTSTLRHPFPNLEERLAFKLRGGHVSIALLGFLESRQTPGSAENSSICPVVSLIPQVNNWYPLSQILVAHIQCQNTQHSDARRLRSRAGVRGSGAARPSSQQRPYVEAGLPGRPRSSGRTWKRGCPAVLAAAAVRGSGAARPSSQQRPYVEAGLPGRPRSSGRTWKRGCPAILAAAAVRGSGAARPSSQQRPYVEAGLPGRPRSSGRTWKRGCPAVLAAAAVRGSGAARPGSGSSGRMWKAPGFTSWGTELSFTMATLRLQKNRWLAADSVRRWYSPRTEALRLATFLHVDSTLKSTLKHKEFTGHSTTAMVEELGCTCTNNVHAGKETLNAAAS